MLRSVMELFVFERMGGDRGDVLVRLLDESADLLESSVGSVWDSHKEVLGGRTVGLLVLNVANAVDEDYVKMLLLSFIISLQLTQ